MSVNGRVFVMNKISKIIWSLFSGAVCLVYKPENASAHNMPDQPRCEIYTGSSTCGALTDSGTNYAAPANCEVSTRTCQFKISSQIVIMDQCTKCKTPYTLTKSHLAGDGSCSSMNINKPLYVYTCECTCSNCTATSSWAAYRTGYEKYTGKGCDCSGSTATCKTITDYRCAANYYGTTSNGTSGCTPCPSSGKSAAGSKYISGCYIPEGTYSDTTGKYAMKCDCPYDGRDDCGSGSSSSSA